MKINHQQAVKEYKVQTLKSLETWIESCADDIESTIITDIEEGNFENVGCGVIPGTSRLYFRLNETAGGRCSSHVLKDALAIWEYLSHTPCDEFGKLVPYFHNYCMFLYHSKTYATTCILGLYQSFVLIVQMAINPGKAMSLADTLILNLAFLFLYILAYRVFRGNLIETEGLSSYVHGGRSDALIMDSIRKGLDSCDSGADGHCEISSEQSIDRSNTSAIDSRGLNKNGSGKGSQVTYCALMGVMVQGFGRYLGDICCWWCAGARTELKNKGVLDFTTSKLVALQQAERESHTVTLSTSSAFYKASTARPNRTYDVFREYKRPLLGFYQQLNICYKFLSLFGDSREQLVPAPIVQVYLMKFGFYVVMCSVLSFITNIGLFFSCVEENSAFCNGVKTQFIFSACGLIPLFTDLVIISNLFVAFAALMYGADVARKLADLWIFRYSSIRRVCSRDLTGDGDEEVSETSVANYFADIIEEYNEKFTSGHRIEGEQAATSTAATVENRNTKETKGLKFSVEDVVKLLAYFPTDAQECYSFRQEFMQQLTRTWNFFLFVVLIFSATLLLTNIFGNAWTFQWFVSQFLTLVFDSTYLIVPLMCLAYANAAANNLRGVISNSGLTDFDVIGGREMWGAYMAEAPAYWSVMGLPITCKSYVAKSLHCLESHCFPSVMYYCYYR